VWAPPETGFYENESLPFKPLHAMMDALSHQLRRPGSRLDRLIADEIGALARLLLVLPFKLLPH
jgi:hypothetical protein